MDAEGQMQVKDTGTTTEDMRLTVFLVLTWT